MNGLSEYCKASGRAVLVVEGKDDCHGIFHFASHSGLQDKFGIWAGENDDQALKHFGGLLAARTEIRPKVLGLVIDCDTSEHTAGDPLTRRWQQVRHRLEGFDYVIPEHPVPEGAILESPENADLPKLGFWIMPDNCSQGMFEDFLVQLVDPETRSYAEGVVDEAAQRGYADFKIVHRSKAVAHTVLAWRDEPGKPIGVAMKMGLFDVDKPIAKVFEAWLAKLFEPNDTAVQATANA
jgi:hypothetical protein